ncbi:MAG: hypothetical protein SGPRY_001649 [Prymnesium sp.]
MPPLLLPPSLSSREPPPRNVYIDLGVSYATTLRLHADLLPALHHKIPPHRRSPRAWEIYGFEASPLLQPYADQYVSWLAGKRKEEPSLRVPPAASIAALRRYATFFGCEEKKFLPCLLDLFRSEWNAMALDPVLNSSSLVDARLKHAQKPNDSPLPRFIFVPAAAGASDEWINLQTDFAGAFSNSVSKEKATPHGAGVMRARSVNFPAWLSRHFTKEDNVILKMAIEGAEHQVLAALINTGSIRMVDLLAWDCHAPFKGSTACDQLRKSIAESDVEMVEESALKAGHDSFSSVAARMPSVPVHDPNYPAFVRLGELWCKERARASLGKVSTRSRDLPLPWRRNLTRIYQFDGAELHAAFRDRDQALKAVYNRLGHRCVEEIFSGLLKDGLQISDIGLNLNGLVAGRHHSADPLRVLEERDAYIALNALMMPDAGPLSQAMMWDVRAVRQPHTLRDLPMAQALLRDGFARVEDWGLDIEALTEQAERALAEAPKKWVPGSTTRLSTAPLPALAPLLNNETVASEMRAYLGGPVRYDGHDVLRLHHNLSIHDYISGHWHHDSCGRRLKLFIFLHDIAETGRPTVIAGGTHNLLYFYHSSKAKFVRFTDEYVRAQYPVFSMTGRRGGGFLFDTNTLHKGLLEGSEPRTTIILEFHALGKVPRIRMAGQRGLNLPCPSAASVVSRERGVPGLSLYLQDVA